MPRNGMSFKSWTYLVPDKKFNFQIPVEPYIRGRQSMLTKKWIDAGKGCLDKRKRMTMFYNAKSVMMSQITPKHMLDNQILLKL